MEGGIMKDAIIFVCRGFANESDMEKYIFPLEKVIINTFTNIPCYRAFLDDEVRRQRFFEDGIFIEDIDSCLKLLISKKTRNVNIIPLIPSYGQWYSMIESKSELYKADFDKINIAKPVFEKQLNSNEMIVLEKALSSSDEVKQRLVKNVEEIIRIKKR